MTTKLVSSLFKTSQRLNRHKITVQFIEKLSTCQLTTAITQLSNPQIVLWYIGPRGLRQDGVHFYRDFIITPILNCCDSIFWLLDLTAWGAFADPLNSIHSKSSCCEKIESFEFLNIKCIKSSEIFEKIQQCKDEQTIKYFKTALKKAFISKSSENFTDRNILIKDIFNCPSSIVSDWYNCDAGKSYSVFQYLEGCLIVEKIFLEQVNKDKESTDIQIVFALPNDEAKYYKDSEQSFQKDVSFLISNHCHTLGIKNITLDIKFITFEYGSRCEDRPYNAPGKVLKKNNLCLEDIVGHQFNIQKHSQVEFAEALNL